MNGLACRVLWGGCSEAGPQDYGMGREAAEVSSPILLLPLSLRAHFLAPTAGAWVGAVSFILNFSSLPLLCPDGERAVLGCPGRLASRERVSDVGQGQGSHAQLACGNTRS